MSSDATTCLTFESVTMPVTARYERPVSQVTFALAPGEALLLQLHEEQGWPPLADLAQGLIEPEAGRVLIGGHDWKTLSPDQAALQRSRMGRVFEEQAWISNLDVDENITLARRHYSAASAAAVYEEAQRWSRHFEQEGLPTTRPAWTTAHELIVSQWVRALLGEPELLIFEEPTRAATHRECTLLVEAVNEQRQQGTTVCWLTSDHRLINNPSLNATHNVKLAHGIWEMA